MGAPEIETPLPDQLGGETGERGESPNLAAGEEDHSALAVERRSVRFVTQRSIALICRADAKANFPQKFPSDVWRVTACAWCRSGQVSVVQSVEFQRAHYKGLQTCGSVWTCPLCASKIEERRRLEIVQVFAWANSEGFDSSLITNTFSHGQGDNLADLFSRQARALKLYRTSRTYVREMKRLGYVAMVRSLEITHGQNGFHPHTHEVQFHRETLSADDAASLRTTLVEAWKNACERVGLFSPGDDAAAFHAHALDIKHRFTCGDYLAKQDDQRAWTPAHEIAKASSKQGRRSGVHPFQLATRGSPGDDALFLEYARATKGKRKLLFSPGLKKRAGIADVSDEAIAEREEDTAQLIANLPPAVWDFIRKMDREHNTRAGVLTAAEQAGKAGIAELLYNLGFRA